MISSEHLLRNVLYGSSAQHFSVGSPLNAMLFAITDMITCFKIASNLKQDLLNAT